MRRQVLLFLRFLALPLLFGVALDIAVLYSFTEEMLFWSFLVHFFGFLALLAIRCYRHIKEHLFKATFSVFTGAAVAFVVEFIAWKVTVPSGVEPWVFALYLAMMVISVTALFAYSIALKALSVSKEFDKKYMKKDD